jgi:hypothetical protein
MADEQDDERTISLRPARPFARVLSGIATVVVAIGFALAVFAVFPGVARAEMSPLAVLVVLVTLGAAAHMVQRRVAGPPLLLGIGDGELRLRTASGELLIEAPLNKVIITHAAHRAGYMYRAYVIDLPGRRLSLGVLGGEPADPNAERIDDPTHWIDPSVAGWISQLSTRQ